MAPRCRLFVGFLISEPNFFKRIAGPIASSLGLSSLAAQRLFLILSRQSTGLPEGVRRGFSLDLSDGTFLSSLTASFSVDLSLLFLLIDR
jgi:hypothetical protein